MLVALLLIALTLTLRPSFPVYGLDFLSILPMKNFWFQTDFSIEASYLPSVEEIQEELGQAESIDDFFGKEGIMARLFARTLEQMLEAELTAKLGYEKYEARGRNSGNSRNGKRSRQLQTSGGQVEIAVPRDRQGAYQPT